jgi:hypothetical protein
VPQNKKSKIKVIIMLVSAIVLICGSGITYSLFTSSSKLDVNQKIAKFIFNAAKTDVIELPISNLNPGETSEYTFQVTNNIDNKRSDVNIKYQIIIKTFHFMPLEIKLYKENSETPLLICNEEYTTSRNVDNELVCNADIQTMPYKLNSTDNYKLVVEFPEKYNDDSYMDLVDYIDLEIKSWQAVGE